MIKRLLLFFATALACSAQITLGVAGATGTSSPSLGSVQITAYPHDEAVNAYLIGDARQDGQKGLRAGFSIAWIQIPHGMVRFFVEPGIAFQHHDAGFAIVGGVSPQFIFEDKILRFLTGKAPGGYTLDPFVRLKRAMGKISLETGIGINVFLN